MKDFAFLKYDTGPRWSSYWHQIDAVMRLTPENVLEIGIGHRLVSDYLKKEGYRVVGLDIDKNLGPDIVASVTDMACLKPDSFDVVLCAEVLEHLPFKDFSLALNEIRRVAKKYVVLTLPHWGWNFRLEVKLPLLKEKTIFLKLSGFTRHRFAGTHYWEIGKRGYPAGLIRNIIRRNGFKILKDYVVSATLYHHFFILGKQAIENA